MDEQRTAIRIVADDREGAGGVLEELRRHPGIALEVRRLARGDFLVEDNFIVERKTLRDFAASVIDGRLFRQAAALAREGRRGVLMLEGRTGTAAGLGVSRESLQGALITVSVFYGLAVLRSRDAAETARLLLYLGDQAGRFASGAVTRPGWRPKGKRGRQLYLLQGLPGIGPQRAERLLEKFGSVEKVIAAPAEEWSAIASIGATTAKKIRWALSEPPASYGQPQVFAQRKPTYKRIRDHFTTGR